MQYCINYLKTIQMKKIIHLKEYSLQGLNLLTEKSLHRAINTKNKNFYKEVLRQIKRGKNLNDAYLITYLINY